MAYNQRTIFISYYSSILPYLIALSCSTKDLLVFILLHNNLKGFKILNVATYETRNAYLDMDVFLNSVCTFVVEVWLSRSNAETCNLYIRYTQIHSQVVV